MAVLPSGEWLVQQIDGFVVLLNQYTDEEIVRYDASDSGAAAVAQRTIHETDLLDGEQKAFAHFWCGYFWGCAQ